MEITYRRKPTWKVGYVLCSVSSPITIASNSRSEAIVRQFGYKTPFASSMKEARQIVTRELYNQTRSRTRSIRFLNTEQWHGEPLDVDALVKRYNENRCLEGIA